eukprot:5186814-Prymnesium_polylepis.1
MQARVLVALLVSVAFLALHLFIKPLKRSPRSRLQPRYRPLPLASLTAIPCTIIHICRSEDNILMALIELALILIFTCVLIMKACESSAELCNTYGFGSTGTGASQTGFLASLLFEFAVFLLIGVYLFFIFFGIAMLLLLLVITGVKLYVRA